MKTTICVLVGIAALVSIVTADSTNPPAPGFDLQGSDARAIEIADGVMRALGGRENWDATRYLSWRFFGRRLHFWDKWTGDVRIEDKDLIILMNVNTKMGRAWRAGVEITEDVELARALDRGLALWINDSYWMFMPYKLKDSGVTLKYMGKGKTTGGETAEILQLTFSDVGMTPENRYLVYVDPESMRVVQWDYFSEASNTEPDMTSPWENWRRYGRILLSDGRGEQKHTDIAVFESLPTSVFESPDPVRLHPSN